MIETGFLRGYFRGYFRGDVLRVTIDIKGLETAAVRSGVMTKEGFLKKSLMHATGESRQIVRGLIPGQFLLEYRAKVFVVTWSYQSRIKLKISISS